MPREFEGFPLWDPAFEKGSCGTGFVATLTRKASHEILRLAMESVVHLTHRGALSADAKTGDGAGVLTQIPWKFFAKVLKKQGHSPPAQGDLAVGMVFLPRQDFAAQERCRVIIEEVLGRRSVPFLAWRAVPVDSACLGEKARARRPHVLQALAARPSHLPPEDFERVLYLCRKEIQAQALSERIDQFYIPSFSSRSLVYKGLLLGNQLDRFYPDLKDPDFETCLALFHQRYSTNTFPNWFLAQPFRFLGHNGEINTLAGNRSWMRAREGILSSPLWGADIEKLKPVIEAEGSDSASLDNVLELLALSGRDAAHCLMMLVPEAWQNVPDLDPDLRAFYQYHACLTEPWDGPAALVFSDGVQAGACLDRNGLRPARYTVTKDGLVVLASETGVVEIDPGRVLEKGRLGPGQMLVVDTREGRVLDNRAVKEKYARGKPYGAWIKTHMAALPSLPVPEAVPLSAEQAVRRQAACGCTEEELAMMLLPMARDGKEPIFSMGDDTPLAVLSRRPRPLYAYFKQRFAQVTNPPIDHIREHLVVSLNSILGEKKNPLEETEAAAKQILLPSPVLFRHELEFLKGHPDPDFAHAVLPAVFPLSQGPEGLAPALAGLCHAAAQAVASGKNILILSHGMLEPDQALIPMALAVGAVHHHLILSGQRMKACVIAEAADLWEVHHMAVLIGYGARAIVPVLAEDTIRHWAASGALKGLTVEEGLEHFRGAVDQGLLKVMSKMGISTLGGYRGAQVFEAVGLSRSLVERCFAGTPSRLGGIGLADLARDVLAWHKTAFGPDKPALDVGGHYKFHRQGEYHAFNPWTIKAFHTAVKTNDKAAYKTFSDLVGGRDPMCLRDLLAFREQKPAPLSEVEPADKILRRFVTAAISHGAISREAHETLALAMNSLGGKSNSGEGGEDPARFKPRPDGSSANSAVKQVASGRFGVTAAYLVSARQLEIKMAQGSKPGEGGQIPGIKVSEEIAAIRHTVAGISLISPPPHHDIYSIEDLAQLIHDLKRVNPEALVSVKLVAESGIGAIAAGVAKAHADVIHISGHDGGTGASPLSSIKNAGLPWELGLAEVQQVLMLNDLRGRVLLRVDGGFKTGRDIVVAALFGAEEFGFGTSALVAEGCVMARQCHLNTCPVGVATQDPKWRAKYRGTPEMVVRYFRFVAGEVREILASLGLRSLDEAVGRVDLLEARPPEGHVKAASLDFYPLLTPTDPLGLIARRSDQKFPGEVDDHLEEQILEEARDAVKGKKKFHKEYAVRNEHRTLGARISGEITRLHGAGGLPDGEISLSFKGEAGQSFGAFAVKGLRLVLTGEANDYVGKGLCGGEIVVKPWKELAPKSHEHVIMGNTVLYGATGGSLFAAGKAGERFAVRNSGALAVVEGVGDHACEYMTGGTVVVLGAAGRNFGAGMTGGAAYVFDPEHRFKGRHNPELVLVDPLGDDEEGQSVKALVQKHADLTGSALARELVKSWAKNRGDFWRVHPRSSPAKTEAVIAQKE